jgi:hypothetical protein
MTIDVWMQHPTLRFLRHEMFDSLRRWTGQQVPAEENARSVFGSGGPAPPRSPRPSRRWTMPASGSGC